jgi:signal transduction histidine kinase/DNA-binding response OmpR family regulator
MRDGLQGNEFFERSFYKSRATGQMFFGGNNGITAFFPDSIRDNAFIPPVVITDFKLFYQSVPIGKKDSPLQRHVSEMKHLELLYSQNVITFEFAALNYVIPEKNQYAYIMEGFDKTWNYVGTEHKATYTNLDPGNYVFRVKASNNDGDWNEEGTTISIYIHPPFWVTGWAFALYAVVIAFTFYYIYRSIVAREKLKSQTAIERLEEKRTHEMDLMKIRFFTNVSHEFRTPITLILGPLQRLMQSGIKDTQTINYYALMHRNAQRLLRMVNQLLDFRKLETGHMKLEAMHGDVVMFVKTIAGAFNYNAAQRNINYTFQSSVDSLQLWFDPDKLDKILYNIISNAFKYTEDDGAIDVSLQVKTENGQEYAQIGVKDNGAGIPNELLKKIFTLFYQVEGSKSGTGIGLALAKEMVELHHGKIEVESEAGKGSHFKILLPLGKDHLRSAQIVERDIDMEEKITAIELAPSIIVEAHDTPVGASDKPIILVIDDDGDIRQYLRDILLLSYHVIEAINSETGFDAAVKEIPDLIISDVMMPGIDGFKFCAMIKGDERVNHVPVILLTAKGAEESKIEGFETGADDFITKPFSDALLLARVKNLILSRKKLKELFGKTTGAQLAGEQALNSIDKKFIEKAIQIVEAHLANTNFDSHAFAHEIGMSRAQLYRKFSAITNQSVSDFIKNIRLKKAADMLVKESKSIAETAYAVGFSERTNFTRTFVKHFGVTPSQYVAAHKVKEDQG